MTDNNNIDEKEKKRRKMFKKMSKVLASCWQLPDATPFQDDDDDDYGVDSSNKKRVTAAAAPNVWKGFTLAPIGRKIDEKVYRFGRHGWEDFAADLGKVYNVHIQRSVVASCCSYIRVYTYYICLFRLTR
jgi:hypothetical protein